MVAPSRDVYKTQGLDTACIEGAVAAIVQAKMLIVGGTSLTVYPAAGLLQYYRGNQLVLINRDPTPADVRANLTILSLIHI